MLGKYMGNFIDLTGKRFGMLTVLEQGESRPVGKRKVTKPYWVCRCDCGTIKEICGDNLRSGTSNSCGCQTRKATIERSTKHGYSKRGKNRSRIYRIWALIKARCERPTSKSYCDYGGRGISLCEEWHDFLTFKDWAYSHGYSDELTIDRIDVNGNYEPSNCRWATTKMQANNQRKTIKITLGEVTHSLKEWCEELNLNYTTVQNRRRRGMDIYEAMFTPVVFNVPIIATDENGDSIEYFSIASAAEAMGVSVTPIYKACSKPDKLYKGYYWRRKIEAA
jgi:hypothetical protein